MHELQIFTTGFLKWRTNSLFKSTESLKKEPSIELDDQEALTQISQAQFESVNELSHQFGKIKLIKSTENTRINNRKRGAYTLYNSKCVSIIPTSPSINNVLQTLDNSKNRKKVSNESMIISPALSSKRNCKTPRSIGIGSTAKRNGDKSGSSIRNRKQRISRLKKNNGTIKPRNLFGTKNIKNTTSDENKHSFGNVSNDSGISFSESFLSDTTNTVDVVKSKPIKFLKRRLNNEQPTSSPKRVDGIHSENTKRSRFLKDNLNFE